MIVIWVQPSQSLRGRDCYQGSESPPSRPPTLEPLHYPYLVSRLDKQINPYLDVQGSCGRRQRVGR